MYTDAVLFLLLVFVMYTYDEFWNILSSAYPVSHGEMKLPITTGLITLPNFDIPLFLQNIRDIYNRLVTVSQNKETLLKYCSPQLVDMMTGTYTGMIRFDCILDTKGNIKLLELNADYPDGILMHDFTYGVLQDGKRSTIHFDNYVKFFDKSKTIFILYKQQFFLDSFYLEKKYLSDSGFDVYIGTRDDLTFVDGFCYYTGIKIEQIRSCMDMSKFTSEQLSLLALTHVIMINSYDLWTLANKALLQEIDHDYIPKTQNLTSSIVSQVLLHKNDYVIKPVDMYEGIGVYLGNATDDVLWESLVKKHTDDNYIAQEFVDMQKMTVQLYDNGSIVEKKLYFDLCPHLFVKDGKIIGDGLVLMRFSENRILNVAQGGGIGYLKI